MNSLDSPFLAQNPDKVAACLPARTQGGRSMGVGSWLAWLGRFGRVLTLAILLLYSIALSGLGSGSSHDFEDLNGCTKSIIFF